MPREKLSAAAARRVALAAQGFGRPRGQVTTRQLNLLLHRLGVLQLDSVNVFERSHYLPVLARLGPYDKALLDKLIFDRRGPYIEYWAHVASVIPIEYLPLLRFRMDARKEAGHQVGTWATSNPEMIEFVMAEVAAHGPMTAGQVEHDENRRTGPWWGWSDVKTALEVLFHQGLLVASHRTRFERFYDLPERRVPKQILERTVPAPEAVRELVRIAASALGVGTVRDIADYFRLLQVDAKAAIADLVDAGELLPVEVESWKQPAWLHRDARIPRRIEVAALLSPFDPIVWERARALRMFGFDYRIEIYTPPPKRAYGYYTMPLLIDEALVGRVDLKSDRQAGALRVQSAWREPGADADVARTATLIREIADWQGLGDIIVQDWGDLARDLATALRVPLTGRP
jgi:uncharacterized protein YcaQ